MNAKSKKQRLLKIRTPYHRTTYGAGFTLVEILVVIAIITALASVAFVSLHIVMVKNRDTIRIYDLKQIALGLEMYHLDVGHYPLNTEYDDGAWDVGNVHMGSSNYFIQPLVDRGIFSKTPIETYLNELSYRYFRFDPVNFPSPDCPGKTFYILAAILEGDQTNYHAADENDPCFTDFSGVSWYVLMRSE